MKRRSFFQAAGATVGAGSLETSEVITPVISSEPDVEDAVAAWMSKQREHLVGWTWPAPWNGMLNELRVYQNLPVQTEPPLIRRNIYVGDMTHNDLAELLDEMGEERMRLK